MFLLLSFTSFSADVILLYLFQAINLSLNHVTKREYALHDMMLRLYSLANLVPLAFTRLLLLIPLNYHTYSGTRLRLRFAYYSFHTLSVCVCIFDAIALAVSGDVFFTSDSGLSIIGGNDGGGGDNSTDVNVEDDENSAGKHIHDVIRSLILNNAVDVNSSLQVLKNGELDEEDETLIWKIGWLLILFSMLSIIMHAIMIFHVRSTAPLSGFISRKQIDERGEDFPLKHSNRTYGEGKEKREMLGYLVWNRYIQKCGPTIDLEQGFSPRSLGNSIFASPNRTDRLNEYLNISTELQESSHEGNDLFSESVKSSEDSLSRDISVNVSPKTKQRKIMEWFLVNGSDEEDLDDIEERKSLTDNVETIMNGNGTKTNHIKENFQRRRTHSWIDGYDDFLSEIRYRFMLTKHQWSMRVEDMKRIIQHQDAGAGEDVFPSNYISRGNRYRHNGPFRAILKLYAYEEVFSNGKLDSAFPNDDNLSLTFYAPQLLCFLLHNAYLNTGKLENWILKRCQTNLFFAHRCYWFLRAWCLEIDEDDASVETVSIISHDASYSSNLGSFARALSGNSLGAMIDGWGLGSNNSLTNGDNINIASSQHSVKELVGESTCKLTPEERDVVKDLLMRIILSGEEAGRIMHYGPINDEQSIITSTNEDIGSELTAESSNASVLISNSNNLIPVDPKSGCPSMAHLTAVTSKNTFGFLPRNSQNQTVTNKREACFSHTTKFLDSLVNIADNLMEIPKSERTSELRRKLRELEVEALPCNSVYVPVNNCMHRVWRIVSSESIAINTKERVPCIICLEVIGSDDVRTDSVMNKKIRFRANNTIHKNLKNNNKQTESEKLLDWYKTPRHPQRLNNLIAKVKSISTKTLKKISSEIENVVQNPQEALIRISHLHNHSIEESFDEEEDEIISPMTPLVPLGDNFDTSPISEEKGKKTPEGTDMLSVNISEKLKDDSQTLARSQLDPDGDEDPNHCLDTFDRSQNLSNLEESASSGPDIRKSQLGQWTKHQNDDTMEDDENLRDDNKEQNKRPFKNNLAKKVNSSMSEVSLNEIDSTGEDKFSLEEIGMKRRTRIIASGNDLSSQEYGSTLLSEPDTSLKDSNSRKKSDRKLLNGDSTTVTDKSSKTKRSSGPPQIVFKEDWASKQERVRSESAYGTHTNWRLLPILIKTNDDLRQEQLASQIIHRMANILAQARVPVWLYPYEIVALSRNAGIIEAIPDTISIDSLRKNYPDFTDLKSFYEQLFGPGGSDGYEGAKANFIESLAAYSIVCFLLQIKDRHNGNILLTNKGHLIHIDFGFFFLSSPGKNSGFESAPFKLTRDFVDLMDGPNSPSFTKFRELCYKTFLELRRNCYQVTLLVEMLMKGNEDLGCFQSRPYEAVSKLQERFRLDLNDRACFEYVNSLIDYSLENWTTTCYDRYQRCFVGVM